MCKVALCQARRGGPWVNAQQRVAFSACHTGRAVVIIHCMARAQPGHPLKDPELQPSSLLKFPENIKMSLTPPTKVTP